MVGQDWVRRDRLSTPHFALQLDHFLEQHPLPLLLLFLFLQQDLRVDEEPLLGGQPSTVQLLLLFLQFFDLGRRRQFQVFGPCGGGAGGTVGVGDDLVAVVVERDFGSFELARWIRIRDNTR